MRFIGNKENLVGKIDEFMQECEISINSTNQSFFDAFSGSVSVGKFFKAKGFQIYSCDLLYCSYCLQMAYLYNDDEPSFSSLSDIFDVKTNVLVSSPYQKVLNFLNHLKPQKGFIYKNYSPNGSKDLAQPRMYFESKNAQKIDAIRMQIEQWKEHKKINEKEYFVLLATLIESVSFFANVAGVYAAFCKFWDKRALKPFYLKEISFLRSQKEHFCFCGDFLTQFENFENHIFDILYLDPPYNHRQYAPNYHLLETIAKYDNPQIQGVAGLRAWQNQKSAFCNAKTAIKALEQIIKMPNYKNLILSYNSEGLMKKDEIDELLKSFGTVHFKAFDYPRFKSNANNAQKFVKEFIWIVKR